MKKADYKWVIVGVCALMIFVCLGFCSTNKSIYVAPVTDANGFSRGLYSVGDTCRYLTTAFVNVFFGTLIAKFGIKKLILCGFGCLILANLCFSVAGHLLLFYLGGCLLGAGFSFTTTAMVGCVVNKWFSKNRGTVMGIILSANGIGSVVAVWILYPVAHRAGDAFAYRDAYRLTIAVLLVTMLIVAVFLKKEKPASGEATAPEKREQGGKWIGMDYPTAIRQKYFWIMTVCIFITGFMLQGITGIAAAHLEDVKMDAGLIKTVLSIGSIALTASKFLTGFIYDRTGLRFTVALCSVAAVITMFSLATAGNGAFGQIAAFLYAVLSSLALPLETIMLPIFAADLFGEKAFDKILGVFVSANTVGFALGSFFVNLVFDIFGSYVPAFLVCGVLMMIVSVAMQIVIEQSRNYRKTHFG